MKNPESVAKRLNLLVDVPSFKVENAIAHVLLPAGTNIGAHPRDKTGKLGNGATHNKVIRLMILLDPGMQRLHIAQLKVAYDRIYHLQFLPDGINQHKPHFGEEYGQGKTGETATSTCIQHHCPRCEANNPGDGQGMQHVMEVEILEIFPADQVDPAVPVLEGII